MAVAHLVLALALLEFFYFGLAVARARATYKVPAPATSGNEVFERYFRVHMNTLEQLIIFVPGI
ncbi:MAG TPA: MAPEG family protein, partial [Steroidobacteraceae bacterium]|nr:MAPEG family protein [Steroidobacteraceae bacterium]